MRHWTEGAVTPSSGYGGGSGCQRVFDSLRVVHGIETFALESTLEILLGDDWSSFILAQIEIAAGKRGRIDADAGNKNESDMSHDTSWWT